MSKQRIRRKGPDGKDLILDVDLGPGKAAASGTSLASPVGHMQPFFVGASNGPRGGRTGGSRAISQMITSGSKKAAV